MQIDDNLKDHILESIGEGVFTVDKNFRINFFNSAAERITGYQREKVIGQFCKHVFRSKLCFTDCPIALALKSEITIYDFESFIHTNSGTSKPIKLNSAVLYNKNCEIAKEFENLTDIELDNRIKELENILNTDAENR